MPQSWFESRVNVYRNDLKLFRVSGRFELSRARVTEGKIIVNVWRKFRGKSSLVRVTYCEVRVSEGSSHRDSSVLQKAYFHLASF